MKQDTNRIDRKGTSIFQLKIENELDWIFREQPISDYGIDAQVEIIENNNPTGQLLAIQLKSGNSFFSRMNYEKNAYIYYGDLQHLEYWINHSLPVILILCNVEITLVTGKKLQKKLFN